MTTDAMTTDATTTGAHGPSPGSREAQASGVSSWGPHALVLALCLALLGAGLLLEPPAAGGDGVHLAGQRLPEVCAMKRVTGHPCPGCGLTRSWSSTLRGRLAAGFGFHPLGWLVLTYALLQTGRHGLWLAWPARRRWIENRLGRPLDRSAMVVGVLLVVVWVPRFLASVGVIDLGPLNPV